MFTVKVLFTIKGHIPSFWETVSVVDLDDVRHQLNVIIKNHKLNTTVKDILLMEVA